jgi:hypothetical protein
MKKQETKKRMFRGGFAECLGYGTWQRGFFLKKFFAECCTQQRNLKK